MRRAKQVGGRARRARAHRRRPFAFVTTFARRTFRRLVRRPAAAVGAVLVAGPVTVTLLAVLALRWVPPPTTMFMLRWRLMHGHAPVQQWVARDRISRSLALAVIAAEDQHFASHRGFDFDAIEDAMREHRVRGRVRGASTITQQVAKNLFLWPGRSWFRKALEAGLTVCIEALWPKRRILEIYLNVAQFGSGIFGAEAAAHWAFHTSAIALDAGQAAQLAAVLPDPLTLHADRPSAYVRRRRSWIVSQMHALGGVRSLDAIGF